MLFMSNSQFRLLMFLLWWLLASVQTDETVSKIALFFSGASLLLFIVG